MKAARCLWTTVQRAARHVSSQRVSSRPSCAHAKEHGACFEERLIKLRRYEVLALLERLATPKPDMLSARLAPCLSWRP